MKRITYILILFVAIVALQSCEKDAYPVPDINLTSVYQLNDIAGENAPIKINIYKEKPLMTRYSTSILLDALEVTEYNDNSSAESYDITLTGKEVIEERDENGDLQLKEIIYHDYVIFARKDAESKGIVELTSRYHYSGNVETGLYTMTVLETEVYN